MKLKPDKVMDTITLRKTINQVILMFPYSLHEIRGHTRIKCSIFCTCENINSWLFLHLLFLVPGLRREDVWIPAKPTPE